MTIRASIGLGFALTAAMAAFAGQDSQTLHSFTMKTIDGADRSLASYKGKVVLVVNTASECGYTPQYAGLEQLYQKYKGKGFAIAAFPANDFGAQEPGTDEQIKTFCAKKFKTTFDLFSKISVKGPGMHPLYQFLTSRPGMSGDVKWNFSKFLVDAKGNVVARFDSKVEPLSPDLIAKLEPLLEGK